MKILIVEDEIELSKSIEIYLKNENFICEKATDYFEALEKIDLYSYDCILLDIGLPKGDGFTLLNEIKRKNKQNGVIIVSAKNSIDDKIKGLRNGADDYLTKPFHLAELSARITSIIRRLKFDGSKKIILKELAIDIEEKTVTINDKNMYLTRKQFELLLFFISNKNKVVSKNSIAEHLTGDDAENLDNFDHIYAHIKNLKKKLTDNGCEDYIKSIYGLGYKFEINEVA